MKNEQSRAWTKAQAAVYNAALNDGKLIAALRPTKPKRKYMPFGRKKKTNYLALSKKRRK